MGMITTSEAADRLGVHRSRVNVLIREGRLPAQRFGKVYLIEEKHLSLVSDRKPGRPHKHNAQRTGRKAKDKGPTPTPTPPKRGTRKKDEP